MFPARTPGNGRSAPTPRGDPSPTPPPARRRTLNPPPPGISHPGSPAAFRHPPAQSRLTEQQLSSVPCSLFYLCAEGDACRPHPIRDRPAPDVVRSEEHTSELQSLAYLVCRLL